MNPQFEDESNEAAAARRARRMRRWLVELALGAAFVAAIFGADRFGAADPPSIGLARFCVALAVGVLAAWFFAYYATYRSLDEFERANELQAVALAGGVAVLFAAAWGLAEAFLGWADFPLAFIAPVFSASYAIIRTLISLRYR